MIVNEKTTNSETEVSNLENIMLKDYSKTVQNVDEKSKFIKFEIGDITSIIKKSFYIWLLDECEENVSNDRLKHFIITVKASTQKV